MKNFWLIILIVLLAAVIGFFLGLPREVLIIIILLVLAAVALVFLPQYLLLRAIPQVIKILRKTGTDNVITAKTPAELKLHHKGFLRRMMQRRDYKPYALDTLITLGIVITTDEGRVYLSEEKLAESPLSKRIKIPPPPDKKPKKL